MSAVNRQRALALAVGLVFGFWLAWVRFTSYDVIFGMLLFKSWFLWKMFPLGVATSFVGVHLLRAAGTRTFIGHEPVSWAIESPTRDTVIGSAIFGVGWAITGSCPGPITAQLGTGQLAGLFTAFGLLSGVILRGLVIRARAPRSEVAELLTPAG